MELAAAVMLPCCDSISLHWWQLQHSTSMLFAVESLPNARSNYTWRRTMETLTFYLNINASAMFITLTLQSRLTPNKYILDMLNYHAQS